MDKPTPVEAALVAAVVDPICQRCSARLEAEVDSRGAVEGASLEEVSVGEEEEGMVVMDITRSGSNQLGAACLSSCPLSRRSFGTFWFFLVMMLPLLLHRLLYLLSTY